MELCVVVPVQVLAVSSVHRADASRANAAVPAGRSGCFVLQSDYLSKGEYDYDLFAASTEYVPDHQRS